MALTVTANNGSRTYGSGDPVGMFGYSITGFAKGDVLDSSEVSGIPNYVCTDSTGTVPASKQPVGNYAITISQPDPQNPLDPPNLTYADNNYTASLGLLRSRHVDDHAGPLDHHGQQPDRDVRLRRHERARAGRRPNHYLGTALQRRFALLGDPVHQRHAQQLIAL